MSQNMFYTTMCNLKNAIEVYFAHALVHVSRMNAYGTTIKIYMIVYRFFIFYFFFVKNNIFMLAICKLYEICI